MGRKCVGCGYRCERHEFSRNQWRKGVGASQCLDCVGSRNTTTFQCGECYREFGCQNELDHHMQIHRPRNVACPICGEVRFRSGANAVQHVESGFCSGCRGSANARQQIYKYASSQSAMRPYMSSVPQLTYGGGNNNNGAVPEYPYACNECSKSFRQLSQLLQHQGAKHNSNRLLGYN